MKLYHDVVLMTPCSKNLCVSLFRNVQIHPREWEEKFYQPNRSYLSNLFKLTTRKILYSLSDKSGSEIIFFNPQTHTYRRTPSPPPSSTVVEICGNKTVLLLKEGHFAKASYITICKEFTNNLQNQFRHSASVLLSKW